MSFLFFIWLFIVSLHHYVMDCIVESNVHLRMPGIGQKISNCWICISLMLSVELEGKLPSLSCWSHLSYSPVSAVLSGSHSVAITTSCVERAAGWICQSGQTEWWRGKLASSWLERTRKRSAPLCFMEAYPSVKTVTHRLSQLVLFVLVKEMSLINQRWHWCVCQTTRLLSAVKHEDL